MMSNKFLRIIHTDSTLIAGKWADRMLTSDFTRTYQKLTRQRLVEYGDNVYTNLYRWLEKNTTPVEIGKIYTELGKTRYAEKYPLCEVLFALHIVKRTLTDYLVSEGTLPDAMELYKIIGFIHRLNDFFDLAGFYLVRGFQEALYQKIGRVKGINAAVLGDVFPLGSFYFQMDSASDRLEKVLEGFNLFRVK